MNIIFPVYKLIREYFSVSLYEIYVDTMLEED